MQRGDLTDGVSTMPQHLPPRLRESDEEKQQVRLYSLLSSAGKCSTGQNPSRQLMELMERMAHMLHTHTASSSGSTVISVSKWGDQTKKREKRTAPETRLSPAEDPEEDEYDYPDVFNATQARSSSDFRRCLNRPPSKETGPFMRPKPTALPPLTGTDPLEWPRFIANYIETTRELRICDVANIERVRAAVSGTPEIMLKRMLLHSSSLKDALDTLRVAFGNPETILRGLEAEVSAAPKIAMDGSGLQLLSIKARGLVNAMEACGMESQLKTISLVTKLQENERPSRS